MSPRRRLGLGRQLSTSSRSVALRLGARLAAMGGSAFGRGGTDAIGLRSSSTRIEKGTDAVRDLAEFGGGIHNAGSNRNTARLAIDGNPATGWAPDPEDRPRRVVYRDRLGPRSLGQQRHPSVRRASSAPFALFDLLLSTGEPETDFIAAPVEGSYGLSRQRAHQGKQPPSGDVPNRTR